MHVLGSGLALLWDSCPPVYLQELVSQGIASLPGPSVSGTNPWPQLLAPPRPPPAAAAPSGPHGAAQQVTAPLWHRQNCSPNPS